MPVHAHVEYRNKNEARVVTADGKTVVAHIGHDAVAKAKTDAAEWNAFLNIEKATPKR